MRVIDYSRHLNQKQWAEMAHRYGRPVAVIALTDVSDVRKEVKRWMTNQVRGDYYYRFYSELLYALGGHPYYGPP